MKPCLLILIISGLFLGCLEAPPCYTGYYQEDGRCIPDTFQCPEQKLSFNKDDGCENDGSLEFCIPRNDTVLLQKIHAIAPSVTCQPGVGRAQCDRDLMLLCFFPTGDKECVSHHGALKDRAWSQVCEIAGLNDVLEITATWYE